MKNTQQPEQRFASIRLLCADCGDHYIMNKERSSLCSKCEAKMQEARDKWKRQVKNTDERPSFNPRPHKVAALV